MKLKLSIKNIIFILAVLVLIICGLIWKFNPRVFSTNNPDQGDKENLVTHVDRGLSEETKINFENRLSSLIDLVKIQETSGAAEIFNTYLKIGNTYYELGQLDLAQGYYEKILVTNPSDAAALENSGQNLYEMGDYSEAEKKWRAAVVVNPWEVTYIKIADLLSDKLPARQGEVQSLLEEAVASIGQTPGLLLRLGDWYVANGKYSEAISHYQVAKQLDSENQIVEQKISEAREAWQASQWSSSK
jgi:tetratricopeptide (TPR) repeat protein